MFHEVAFYAAFAVLIINRRVGYFVFALVVAVTLYLYHFPTDRNPIDVYTSVHNIYFLLGMGAYWFYRRGGRGFVELILGIIVVSALFVDLAIPHQFLPLVRALGMSLLLAASTKLEVSNIFRIPNCLAKLGDASYTIYLTHLNFWVYAEFSGKSRF